MQTRTSPIVANPQPYRSNLLTTADRNPAAAFLAGHTTHTRRAYTDALVTVACLLTNQEKRRLTRKQRESLILCFPWHRLRYQHTSAIRTKLIKLPSPKTANLILTALRGILREAWRLEYMTAEECARACDVRDVNGTRLPPGRALSQGELRALFQTCGEDSPIDIRDAAILAILYGGGLRRAEVVSLNLSDYDPDSGSLKILGKGNRERTVYATNGAKGALERWLTLRGNGPGPLFFPINKGGHLIPRRMTDQAVYSLLKKRAQCARVKEFSPHDLRRTFISDLLDAGADLVTVQKLAGHASPATTSRYDRRGEESKRRASEMLHVPCYLEIDANKSFERRQMQ